MKLVFRKLKGFLAGLFVGAKTDARQRSEGLAPQASSRPYFAEDDNILEDIRFRVMHGNRIIDTHTGEIIESFAKRNKELYALEQRLQAKQAIIMSNPEDSELNWAIRDNKLKEAQK